MITTDTKNKFEESIYNMAEMFSKADDNVKTKVLEHLDKMDEVSDAMEAFLGVSIKGLTDEGLVIHDKIKPDKAKIKRLFKKDKEARRIIKHILDEGGIPLSRFGLK